MNRSALSLALLLAAGLAVPAGGALAQPSAHFAAAAAVAAAPDPASQFREMAQLFRAGDVTGLAQALVPPAEWESLRAGWEIARLQPVSEEDRAEFAQNLQRLTGPDAVERFMTEIEPRLEELRPKVFGGLLMGFGALQMAVDSPDSGLTASQREALRSVTPGLQHWASSTDFLNSETMRVAMTLLVDAARHSGITDLEQIKALPLESVLERAGPMLLAAKDAVRLYGIDLDAVADSLQVEVLEMSGDTARVRTTVTVFNAPLWAEHELVLVDGRWYGKHVLEMHVRTAEFDS